MTAAIDVMLPYYGDVALMKLAVRSVLDQSFTDVRLVVIDDGYPDPEPARWFGEMRDPRVTYLRNETNLGANGNYRKAVELVEADWFVMMGADDVMRPDYLATVADAAQRYDVDLIQPGVEVIDENGSRVLPLVDRVKKLITPRVEGHGAAIGGEDLAASLMRGDWAYFPSIVWRTEVVQRIGFRTGLDVVQDLALILDIVKQGGKMALLTDVVFDYRRHSQSDSSVRALDGRRFDEERSFFLSEAESFDRLGWPRAARFARRHLTSRLNAASLLLKAARTPGGSVKALMRHIWR
ncbi:glycosyltransferase [Microbacterium sp. p3-SID338]|uniref:glycosyltransferase family 2 protein n=1 Tax=unclassified Microbacterium TaxID=2609290 RepID=UPI000788F94C|nr:MULTISPECIES: glycosyltransferase family 2 protein [unclassified Microbacterium]KYJ99900.1 glycosyl transferase family 2 [Microbacterium sp. CH1]MCT1395311.1 glycosyltransferase [Microbacterium sp. p3-SID338]